VPSEPSWEFHCALSNDWCGSNTAMRKRILQRLPNPPQALFWPLVASLVGLLVGCGWVAYAFVNAPDIEVRLSVMDRVVQVVAYLTCPILAVGLTWHWMPLVNAATYGLIALLWQANREKSK
jgi:hypothetical protein